MKILTFVDVHTNKLALRELARKARDADLLICAGDVSVFGRGMEETLLEMNTWGKPILIIHGNHEDEMEMKEAVSKLPNLHWIHGCEVEVAGLSVVGWGGGGFAHIDPELEEFAAQLEPKANRIIVFHGPPYGTAVDFLPYGEHTGCRTRREVIEHLQPFLAISGHIHETFGERDQVGRTICLNPGPVGVVIELNPPKGEQSAAPETPKAEKSEKEEKKKAPAERKTAPAKQEGRGKAARKKK